MERIENFKNLKLGMFVHFGLYSIVGKGEWYMHNENVDPREYEKLMARFRVRKNWAKELVKTAKSFGAKYIVLTTRHHDGFSLYDTKGLSEYDIMHTPTNRDLIKEFVDECNSQKIIPFFYHTLIDWHDERFENDRKAYFDYLHDSLQILCTNYGQIGGFWFDGTWKDDNADWHLDEIFGIVRELQPDAIISNNGGLEHPGQIIHKEVDCIVFERGKLANESKKTDGKKRAKEICQTLNNHWGYVKNDKNYKTKNQLNKIFDECIKYNANLLINVGPKPNGIIRLKERQLLKTLKQKSS